MDRKAASESTPAGAAPAFDKSLFARLPARAMRVSRNAVQLGENVPQVKSRVQSDMSTQNMNNRHFNILIGMIRHLIDSVPSPCKGGQAGRVMVTHVWTPRQSPLSNRRHLP